MPSPALRTRVDGVVIGASAGGVEALSVLLPALRPPISAAFFVVLHLPRERPSMLVELFRPKCALPVFEARDKAPVQPGTICFAPPDYHLLLDPGPQLALSVDALVQYSRPSIDVLFESAADVYRERLLGLVLTGGSSDGAVGLNAVRRAGGLTAVQDPRSAMAPLMPQAALAHGAVDFVLPPDQLADLLRMLEGPV